MLQFFFSGGNLCEHDILQCDFHSAYISIGFSSISILIHSKNHNQDLIIYHNV